MSQYSSRDSEGPEYIPSPSTAEQQPSIQFETFSLEELLQIVEDGMDSDGPRYTMMISMQSKLG
ncbi:hypothetical protein V1506DRAFT_174602 [Lipomyces tetrasporus]